MQNNIDTVIIGSGFAGLAAAYALQKKGIKSLILEKGPSPGGMASCHDAGSFMIEKFYHHFFSHDDDVISLINELGKGDRLIWSSTSMGFYPDNKLYNLTTPLDLLRFSHISLLDRLSFALFSYKVKKGSETEDLDSLSTEEWLGNKIGSSAYLKIMAPLIKSKFGVHMNDISAAFLSGRVKARVNSRTKLFGREKFGYYIGGLDDLSAAMLNSITDEGGAVRFNSGTRKITGRGDNDFSIETADGKSVACSSIVSTIPLPILSRQLSPAPAELPGFDYRSVVCMCLGVKKSLSRYYWINIASDELPFGIIIGHTNLVPSSNYNGDDIIYLATYCDSSSDIYRMDDDKLFGTYISGLKKVFPDFSEDDVLWKMVSREPYASPVFKKNFSRDTERLRSAMPTGLHLAGNIVTYPNSRNVNSVIRTGKRAAREIIDGYGK